MRTRSIAPARGWGAPRVGYALALDGRRGFRHIAPPASGEAGTGASPGGGAVTNPGAGDVAFALFARPGPRADLLWTWPRSAPLNIQRELVSADERRLAVLVGDLPAAPIVEAAHLLRFWPTDIDAAPEAAGLAADYRAPALLAPAAGERLRDVSGDLDHDGYNESEGCYELAPAGSVLRVDFDPGRRLRFDPVFRVSQTRGRQAWVYVRGPAHRGRRARRGGQPPVPCGPRDQQPGAHRVALGAAGVAGPARRVVGCHP